MICMIYSSKRQILLFYNSNGIAAKEKQLSVLNSQLKEMQERDIEIHTYDVSNTAAAKQWKVSSKTPFTFILVGKDGGEKMRTDTVVSTAQLFAIIDAMPMRKNEMKKKQ